MNEIIYFLPDADAGVASIIKNILKYKKNNEIIHKVCFYYKKNRNTNRIKDNYNVDEQIHFEYSGKENLYSVFNRLKKYIKSENSIIVASDNLEIRMANALKLKNPLVYIIHGDFQYYYQIAKRYQDIIDMFITYSKHNHDTLLTHLDPQNHKKVKLIYYPSPQIKTIRKNILKDGVIKLIFVGYLIERKGIQFFKPTIDELIKRGVNFEFSIIGSGQEEKKLKKQFKNYENVKFIGQLKNENVLKKYEEHNILFFPTLSEGLPNVLVEAMKSKCVPVVSDIPSGIPDLIEENINGFKIPIGDYKIFADKIEYLYKNPELLEQLGQNAKNKADKMFSPSQAEAYETEILNSTKQTKEKIYKRLPLGGILNKPYLPNFFVKTIRSIIKHPKI